MGNLISSTQQAFAHNPADTSLQQKLQALLALKKVLDTQTLPPQQLEAVRNQIKALAPTPAPMITPMASFIPSVSLPQVMHTPQPPAVPSFAPSTNAPPSNLAQLLASVLPQAPIVTNPSPAPASGPAPLTQNLADLLRHVSSPAQSSTPAMAPFYPPPFAAPQVVSTPIPAPAIPAPAPAPASTPTATPAANLAQLLANLSKPAATPTISQAPPVQPLPLPQAPSQSQAPASTGGGAPSTVEWLLKALNGMPGGGTPLSTTPLGSEPMTRQSSGPIGALNDIELTTASMKK